ncbi:transposase [Frankia sp. Mgl5]|uniref:transposase n=1 Tax=Frankia sp. Mgl5 TaxID=2933793 RepID=UPI002034F2A3
MESSLALRLVPDDLWELVEPLLPRFETRHQGGGTAPIEDRAVFTAVVYVLTAGCAWRHLPAEFDDCAVTLRRLYCFFVTGCLATCPSRRSGGLPGRLRDVRACTGCVITTGPR